jgi:hypothetical protein
MGTTGVPCFLSAAVVPYATAVGCGWAAFLVDFPDTPLSAPACVLRPDEFCLEKGVSAMAGSKPEADAILALYYRMNGEEQRAAAGIEFFREPLHQNLRLRRANSILVTREES